MKKNVRKKKGSAKINQQQDMRSKRKITGGEISEERKGAKKKEKKQTRDNDGMNEM